MLSKLDPKEQNEAFDGVVYCLPALCSKMEEATGRDPLTLVINDLGNMWTMVLLTGKEFLAGDAGIDVAVVDDVGDHDDVLG